MEKYFENIPEVCPLAESQKGIYLECVSDPEALNYNISVHYTVPAGVEESRLVDAIKKVIKNHPALNVCFRAPGGVPSMIYSAREPVVAVKDTDDLEEEIKNFSVPFDLENGPVYKITVFRTKRGLDILIDVHHLIFDGTSFSVFASQLAAAYNGEELPAEELTIFDLAADDEKLASGEEYEKDSLYFEEKLSSLDVEGNPVPDVVTDVPTSVGTLNYDVKAFEEKDVLAFASKNKVSENAVFLAAFGYTLAAFNGTDETFFRTVHNGRRDKKFKDSFGMFVRTLPMVTSVDPSAKVSDFVKTAYDDYFGARTHASVGYSELAAKYNLSGDVTLVFQSDLFKNVKIGDGELSMEFLPLKANSCDFDVMVKKCGEKYVFRCNHRRETYSDGFVKSFAESFEYAVKTMLISETLADVSVCAPSAKARLDEINATECPYEDDKTVVDLFRRQARLTPDEICLVYEDKKYTYREMDELTDVIAENLKLHGVGREKVVGVLIPRCEYMLIAPLGILKAGGAYMPLDPSYPPERLNLMMNDSGAMMLIYDKSLSDIIGADFGGIRFSTEEISAFKPVGAVPEPPKPEDLFIILYTSGSTGIPKGVMYNHSNMSVTDAWVKKYFEYGVGSRVAAYASFGFDANTYDMYPAVTSGAQLHIISEDIRLDFPILKKYFNDNGITHTVMTAQIGRQFASLGGFTTLKHLSVAGEKLTPPDIPEGFILHNAYGPSEGSVITSSFELTEHYKDVPIGAPVDNLKIYVADKRGNLLPIGAVGELWIAGPHVTRGYLNRPEKTAEVFGTNPFDDIKGYERVYKTGDIVRIMPDGNLQFVGRRDAQVKIRGFRVELTEIEEIIRRFDGVKDATVAAFDDPAGGKFVAAYVVSDKKISIDAVKEFILAEKPPYMVPAVIMQIDKIPLSQNQKVNKRALPIPKRELGNITKPENDFQSKIFDVIASVINHREFGIDTDIYEAGLTSIGAVKLNVELAEAFGVPIKIADIKANETVRKLERFINSKAPVAEYEIYGDYPLTESQNGIFIECMANPGSTVYNIPVLIKLADNVDTKRLTDAVIAAVNAHPFIKTTLFTSPDGSVRMKRNDDDTVTVDIVKCASLPDTKEFFKPFELLGSKLYRIYIFDTAEGKYLFMDIHHIICDGASENILFADIDKAYAGGELQKEKFSGFELALEESKVLESGRRAEAEEYWKSLLASADTECLPKKEAVTGEGAATVVCRGNVSASKIKEYCEKENLSLNAYFNGVFSFVLGRLTGKDDPSYATVYNGRSDSRIAFSVLFAVKTIPVVADISGEREVKAFVRDMQSQLISSMSNDACPFSELSSKYGAKADVMFVYQGDNFVFDSLCGEKASLCPIASETAKAPVSVTVAIVDDKFEYTVEYKKDYYSPAFASSFADALDACASEFALREKLKNVCLLTEKGESLYENLNARKVELKPLCPYNFVELHAAEKPDAEALTSDGKTLTFSELNSNANKIANSLLKLGLKRGEIVGVVLDRSVFVPAAEIGVMKAGGAFLPTLPSYPDDRIEFCLTDAESPFVITSEALKAERSELFSDDKPYKTLTVEKLLESENDGNPDLDIGFDDLAYCIYTSGSTGKPKGVMVEHRNMTNMIQTHWSIFSKFYYEDTESSALAICSVSFDASIMDIYVPLCGGRHLYIATEEEIHNPLTLRDLMVKHNIGTMVSTPSAVSNLVSMPEMAPAFAKMKSLMCGAEVFPSSLYEGLRKFNPELQILNGYGPTECCVCCSYIDIKKPEGITIGKAIGNTELYVVDAYGNVLPPYCVGELLICGEGVGRGYVKLPEKTAKSFVGFKGKRAYHSGDLVRLNGDAEIDFGGRMDNQVKVRGFRVELDEIEKVMCAYNHVKQSKVIVRNNGNEDYLAGYFTADKSIDIDSLTSFMKSALTYYMVPSVMMQLGSMPLTPNGKIDKKALPEIQRQPSKKGRRAAKKSLEQRLCEMFADILGSEEVYADDNFFELGGTSLTASKVTMLLMSDGIEVKYGDIFDNPTPESLAAFIESRDGSKKAEFEKAPSAEETANTREALKYNCVKYAPEVKREPLGNVLLTGANGFLGVHVLDELLKIEKGHIWCLVRRGEHESPEVRLKTMLVYYFSKGYEEELKNRITVIEADITDENLGEKLADVPFDTVINCAACVKHFTDDDILERINVRGVENLISICSERNKKLIQISTVSVPGIHTKESYEKQIRMHENELFVIDDMDNKYGISKYQAELRMFDAIEKGLRGKVIRVGNLMGRHSDGEFQANMETNMFLSGIRGFAFMGKYPISHMTDPMRFSPIDCTARAVIMLAGTNDIFTAFNCDNRYGFDEMKIIDACNRNGLKIVPAADEEYYKEFREKLGDEGVNARLNGLAAYDIKDAHAVDTDNLFTTNVLYRVGFSWPLVDDTYLDRAINSIMTLDYFGMDENND